MSRTGPVLAITAQVIVFIVGAVFAGVALLVWVLIRAGVVKRRKRDGRRY